MSDERLGLVSASRFEIFALCPGSEQLRRMLPPEALNTSDRYSERGSKLHKAFETENSFPLDESDLEIYNRGIATANQIVEQWLRDFDLDRCDELEREERLFLHDESLRPVASGQLDRKYRSGSHILIIDFKALWCSNLTPAEQNYQGRLQAVLAANEYDATHVRMSFVKAMFGRGDSCDYDANALTMARWSVFYHIWESEQPGAPFKPGDWCTYCPCKAYCKDAAGYAALPVVAAAKNPLEMVKAMSPADLLPYWQREGQVMKIFAAIKERLKSLPPEELSALGLKLVDGKKADFILDTVGAFKALRDSGIDDDSILKTMSFSKEPLLKLIQEFTNCAKKQAELVYETKLDEFIKRERNKPSLVET